MIMRPLKCHNNHTRVIDLSKEGKRKNILRLNDSTFDTNEIKK